MDSEKVRSFPDPPAFLREMKRATSLDFFDGYEEYVTMLKNFSQVFIRCTQCETPHVYVFVLPTSEVQKNESLNLKASSVFSHAQNLANPNNKEHDKVLYAKWTADERE